MEDISIFEKAETTGGKIEEKERKKGETVLQQDRKGKKESRGEELTREEEVSLSTLRCSLGGVALCSVRGEVRGSHLCIERCSNFQVWGGCKSVSFHILHFYRVCSFFNGQLNSTIKIILSLKI